MRDTSDQQIESLVALTSEDLGPHEHPIRRIEPLADRVLQELSPTFSRMYAKGGRPSVPPEHLLKASFLIALYSVRSERQFCERLTYDTRAFVTTCRSFGITPHVAMKQWHSVLDRGTEPSRGVRGESPSAEAGRGGVRLAEDRRGRKEAALLRRGPQRPVGGDGSGGLQPRAHGQAYAPALISGGGPCLLRMTCPNRRRQRPDQGRPRALLTPNRRPTVPQCRHRPGPYIPNSHSSPAC